MARVLVTGAKGFLGRYAVEALQAAGWSVIGSGRTAPDAPGSTEFVPADLLQPNDAQALVDQAQADILLHLAWFDDPRARWHAAENLDWVAATLHLCQCFAKSGGSRVVFGSSCAVYDFAARGRHCEGDTPNPASLYGAAKAATGSLLTASQDVLGLTVAEARMFYCYGAGEPEKRLVPDLISGLRQGKQVPCSDGAQRRDYMHAHDIGRALALICASDVSGPINVSTGEAIAVADLIREFAGQMGRPDLPEFGAIARAPNDPPEVSGDAKTLRQLGFRPNLDLKQGVADVLSQELGGAFT